MFSNAIQQHAKSNAAHVRRDSVKRNRVYQIAHTVEFLHPETNYNEMNFFFFLFSSKYNRHLRQAVIQHYGNVVPRHYRVTKYRR